MKEKIILQSDVDNLGLAGETVEVAKGYARNFLYPKGFALPATKANEKVLAAVIATVTERRKKLEDKARELAAVLEELSLVIGAKVGEAGRLFGSVTTIDLAKSLAEAGHDINRRKIDLKENIKQIGQFEATVRLEAGITAAVAFTVVSEDLPAEQGVEEALAFMKQQAEAASQKAETTEAEEAPAEEAPAEEASAEAVPAEETPAEEAPAEAEATEEADKD